MDSSVLPHFLLLLLIFLSQACFQFSCHALSDGVDESGKRYNRRILVGFKENPSGSNNTFQCSPSGPCVPCLYSEKSDGKYRCSETGYRIPLKCVEVKENSKDTGGKNSHEGRSNLEIPDSASKFIEPLENELAVSVKHRGLQDVLSTSDNVSQAYITFRSCVPAMNEEKLSVIHFEGIMLCLLLVSGSVVYLRKKQTASVPGFGAGRVPTSSRF